MEATIGRFTSNFISQNPSSDIFKCPLSLIEAFLSGSLSCNIKDKLTTLYNDYYKTALSSEQLKEVFAESITHIDDRKEILNPIWDGLYNFE